MRQLEIQLVRLLDAMVLLTGHYQSLIEFASTKTEAIKQNDIRTLTNLLIKENALVQLIGKQESKRQAVVEALFVQLQLDGVEKTMGNLLLHLPRKVNQTDLQNASRQLMDCLGQLQQIEKTNTALLQQSLAFVQFSLNVLQPYTNMTYSDFQNVKQIKHLANCAILDTKA